MQTYAERFSDLMGNDGQTWQSTDGIDFLELARDMGAYQQWEHEHIGARVRYVFPDGSAIVEAGDAWDFEGGAPFSWRG
jgi:hypothetical protein